MSRMSTTFISPSNLFGPLAKPYLLFPSRQRDAHNILKCSAYPPSNNPNHEDDPLAASVTNKASDTSRQQKRYSVVDVRSGPFWNRRKKAVYRITSDGPLGTDAGQPSNGSPPSLASDSSEASFRDLSDFPPLRLLRNAVLPQGWPETVGPGYADWAKWHIGRHTFRNAYYVIGTTSLLYSLGLGTGAALAVGATLKWVLKDGLGMGTKLFVSTKLAAVVDIDPKRWRFTGDSLMVACVAVEILSVTKPDHFLLFGTVAALLKQAADAISGPAYRVFLDSFATNSNIGDVSSRGEAQVVLGNLVGLGLGVAVTNLLSKLPEAERLIPTLMCFAVLASCHLTCTFKAISTVQLKTLNWQRLNIIIDEFLRTGTVLSIAEVNVAENFIYLRSPPPPQQSLRIGVPLFGDSVANRDIDLIFQDHDKRFILSEERDAVGVTFREDAGVQHVVEALLQAKYRLRAMGKGTRGENAAEGEAIFSDVMKCSAEGNTQLLSTLLERGWSLKKMLIPFGRWQFREG